MNLFLIRHMRPLLQERGLELTPARMRIPTKMVQPPLHGGEDFNVQPSVSMLRFHAATCAGRVGAFFVDSAQEAQNAHVGGFSAAKPNIIN